MRQRALLFYTYLPPWRIDVFNEMGKYYDLHIFFLDAELEDFRYNRELLVSKLNVKHTFYNKGFKIGSRPIRFGIFRFLKAHRPTVVFSHEYSPTSILLALFLKFKLLNYQLVITTSDNLIIAQKVKGVKALARKFVLSSAKGIVVYSSEVKVWYQQVFKGLQVEICPNIQNPKTLLAEVDIVKDIANKYKLSYGLTHKKVLLYIGRFSKEKGLDLLLNAFSKYKHNDSLLVLVGKGNFEVELKSMVAELKINNKVIFPGYFSGNELYAWYYAANVFILPSRYEPFGAVVNEALIFGCPVLASKYIGATDFIKHDYNGFVFDPLNEEDFVNALNYAFEKFKGINTEKKNLMIREFNNYVENFKKIVTNES